MFVVDIFVPDRKEKKLDAWELHGCDAKKPFALAVAVTEVNITVMPSEPPCTARINAVGTAIVLDDTLISVCPSVASACSQLPVPVKVVDSATRVKLLRAPLADTHAVPLLIVLLGAAVVIEMPCGVAPGAPIVRNVCVDVRLTALRKMLDCATAPVSTMSDADPTTVSSVAEMARPVALPPTDTKLLD